MKMATKSNKIFETGSINNKITKKNIVYLTHIKEYDIIKHRYTINSSILVNTYVSDSIYGFLEIITYW